MAKVKYSALVSGMSGKLNGSVMAKNKAGDYIRTKVTPTNPQTTAQVAARNRLATWAQAWRGITQAQRNAWIAATASFPVINVFGDSKLLSGNALYTQLNTNLALIGASAIDDAPSPVAITAITALSATAAAGTPALSITFAPTPVATGEKLLIEATPCVPPSQKFVKNRFRVIASVASAGTSPYNALSAYAAVFGNPVEDQVIYIRVTVISSVTGQRGVPVQTSATVAA